ncbi:MAG: DNA repair protein RecO [Prevotella sp.]|nr:DNA repair protein RecO [Prevotella sp.]
MMTRTRAVVLRTVRYGDTSLVVDMLTGEQGRVSFMVKVSKSPRGKMRKQLFQPLNIVEIDFDYRANRSLQRLRDIHIAAPLASLHLDPYKLSIGMFLAEFLIHATRDEHESELLYRFVESSILWLDEVEQGFANFHLVFMIRLTRFVGFFPNTDDGESQAYFDLLNGCFTPVPPPHAHFLMPAEAGKIGLLMRLSYKTMHLCAMSRMERNRCTEVILEFYRLHVPGFPEMKSLEVLKQLFT